MKNFLKTVLAMVMVLALCVTSFASNEDPKCLNVRDINLYEMDEDGEYLTDATFELGKDLYMLVDVGKTVEPIDRLTNDCKLSDLKDFRIKSNVDIGNNVVGNISFERVKMSANEPALAIKIEIKHTYNDKPVDVVGDIIITAKHHDEVVAHWDENGVVNADKEVKIPFAYSLEYSSDVMIDFDDDSEYEGDVYGTDVTYEVNAKGQKPLYIKGNNNIVTSLIDKYPEANLSFVNFEGSNKTFYRTCTLHIPYDYNGVTPFIYARLGDELTPVDGSYMVEDEEFVVKTKILENYVISDKELDMNNVKPVTPNTNKPVNPPTGAVEDSGNNNVLVYGATAVIVLVIALGCVLIYKNNDKKKNNK